MDFKNIVACVTGASSGIGAAVARELVKNGAIVIGLARRVQRMETLKNFLPDNLAGNFHPMKCDVSKVEDIVRVFQEIDQKFGAISILVNCAGVLKAIKLLDRNNSKDLRATIDTNLFGTVFCVREAYHLMKKRGVNDGKIVNIDSILGHKFINLGLLNLISSLNVYPSSKFAVTACNEVLRQEFIEDGSDIKLTVSYF
jgi:NADP+-dependent farnesol dehydrogenase